MVGSFATCKFFLPRLALAFGLMWNPEARVTIHTKHNRANFICLYKSILGEMKSNNSKQLLSHCLCFRLIEPSSLQVLDSQKGRGIGDNCTADILWSLPCNNWHLYHRLGFKGRWFFFSASQQNVTTDHCPACLY